MYRLQATSETHELFGHPGAGESLEKLLGAQRQRIEWTLRKHLGARQDIDDLVQIVYLELLRALPRFRGESSLSTFIGGIALMVVRRARRGTAWDARKAPLDVEVEEARAPSPEQTAIAREQVRRVERALGRISAVKREAYLMHLDGLTPEEISKRTRSSLAATRSRIFYAKKELGVRARKDDALRELVSAG